MRVLELGTSVAPAFAGMILHEQGHEVTKWANKGDAIFTFNRSDELWHWLNHCGKTVRWDMHAKSVIDWGYEYDIVIDNFRAETWHRWGIDPSEHALDLGVRWVSLRAEDDGRSFDLIAQARGWGDHGRMPFFLGDTTAGLWLAYKALASEPGHYVIRQAVCLAKMIEGEGIAPWDADRPWIDPERYVWDDSDGAKVIYRDETITEPPRDAAWRLSNLPNKYGRFTI